MFTEDPRKKRRRLGEDQSPKGKVRDANFPIFVDKVEKRGLAVEEEERTTYKEKGEKEVETDNIREVLTLGETNYFVGTLYLDWPGEDIMAEAARQQDAEERKESIAKSSRGRWAEEIILAELWSTVKRRKDCKRWAKEILLDKFDKVILCRNILTTSLEDLVEDADEKARKKRIEVKEPEIIEKIGEENTEERRLFRKPRRRLGKGETPKPHAETEEVKIDKKNNKTGNVTSLRKIFEKEEHEKKTKKHEENGRKKKNREWEEIVVNINKKDRKENGPVKSWVTKNPNLTTIKKTLEFGKKGDDVVGTKSEANTTGSLKKMMEGNIIEVLEKKEISENSRRRPTLASGGNNIFGKCLEIEQGKGKRRPSSSSWEQSLEPGMNFDWRRRDDCR